MPLKTFTAKNFFGRNNELDVLKGVASEALAGDATDVFLSGKWGTGKTELLKHLFNHLFWKHNYVIPFFYTINSSSISIEEFSRDYLNEFLLQSLAYLKKDYSILDSGIFSMEDLMQLAKDSDAGWAVNVIKDFERIHGSDKLSDIVINRISNNILRCSCLHNPTAFHYGYQRA